MSLLHYCRAKKFRDRRKAQGYKYLKVALSKDEAEEKRLYNRLKKRESRQRLSDMQKEEVKHYDRERHKPPLTEEIKVTFLPSIVKASQRVRKVFPRSPRKCVMVLRHVLKSTLKSPRKKLLFHEHGVLKAGQSPVKKKPGKYIIKNLKSLKRNKDFYQHQKFVSDLKQRYSSLRKASVQLGLRWNTLQRMCAYPQKSEDSGSIPDFYINSDVTVTLPDKKYVGVNYLNRTVAAAHEEYVNTSGSTVSFSKFYRLKPKRVKLQSKIPQRQCICEVCANASLGLEALSQAGVKVWSNDLRSITKRTMCQTPNTDMKCVTRKCDKCGVQNVLEELIKGDVTRKISWKRWTYVTQNKEKVTRKLVLTHIAGNVEQLIEMITNDLIPLSLHLFNADWQQKQFSNLIKDVPDDTLVQVLDFAKNYLCSFQDEPQGCYWDHQQVTLHPIVCYYKDPQGNVVTEEIMCISDDLKHDSYAVQKFEDATMNHFKEKNMSFGNIVQFSDQCPGQYKSHVPFEHLSCCNKKQRLYFGSRHGKGPADGAIGRVKKAVTDAVRSRRAIVTNGKDFYKFCIDNLETTNEKQFQQHFCYIPKIVRKQKSKGKTIPGTRKIHQVRMVEHGIIEIRNVGCTCQKCLRLSTDVPCPNEDRVGPWKRVDVLGKSTKKKINNKNPENIIPGSASKCAKMAEPTEKTPRQESSAQIERPGRVTRSAKRTIEGRATSKSNDSVDTTPHRVTRSVSSRKLHTSTPVKSGSRAIAKKTTCIDDSGKSSHQAANTKTAQEDNTMSRANGNVCQTKSASARKTTSVTTKKGTVSKKMTTWGKIQAHLSRCKTFEDMEDYIKKYRGPELSTDHLKLKIPKAKVDQNSLKYIPSDVTGFLPVSTLGDGNCFPRALSTLVFGNQFHFQEMRGRIVYEGVQNMKEYLRQNYLSHGANVTSYSRATLSEIYTQYSDEYQAGTPINSKLVKQVFENELLKVAKNSSYCGVWQIFMAANILKKPIVSHYPQGLNPNITNDLNRTMYPLEPSTKPAAHILWTYMNRSSGFPNHFVPLLPITKCLDASDQEKLDIPVPNRPQNIDVDTSKHLCNANDILAADNVSTSCIIPSDDEDVDEQLHSTVESIIDNLHININPDWWNLTIDEIEPIDSVQQVNR